MYDGEQTFALCNGINSPVFLITIGCGPEIGIFRKRSIFVNVIRFGTRMKEVEEVWTAHDEGEGVHICGVAPASADRYEAGWAGLLIGCEDEREFLKKRGRAATVLNDWEWFAMP